MAVVWILTISTEQAKLFSIVEGTQESLARLGLDYVDIIFAHRHDHNGLYRLLSIINILNNVHSSDGGNCTRIQLCYRKGLGKNSSLILDNGCLITSYYLGVLLGNVRVECQ